ncbi:integrase [Liquorilactobacillus ghanensis DSM 18630]|uniref:Integrase n=1 Tax=Liquorilactobacillus ghanensis DSM 18630 TaxID=1423750 RepID=A0A0R1VPG9_9LACO|nr:site-specific integrase [Liquorilactobacillus ghanensis]KRM07728.1 integrase [Liquorilactobacillus ghanensis DSM 18630]
MFEYKKNKAIKEKIYKNGKKSYYFQIYLGTDSTGKPKRTTKRGFKTPALANAAYRKIQTQVLNGTYEITTRSSKTFKDEYLEWFENQYRNTVKSSTLYKTKQIFDCHILPDIGDLELNKITSDILQPIVENWISAYKKPNIVSRYAKRVFDYAYIKKEISANPFDHVLLPKVRSKNAKDSHNFLSTDELKKFVEYVLDNSSIDDPGKIEFFKTVFFITLAYTGMRKGELLALTWKDVDLENKTIDINKTIVTNESGKMALQPPKWDSYRKISINQLTFEMLSKLRKINNSKLVFPNQKDNYFNLSKPNNWLNSIIDMGSADYAAAFKLTHDQRYKSFIPRITPHGFRHTHATWLFEKNPGILPKTVQKRLGHKNIGVTLNIYTHVSSNQNELLSETINDL